MMTAKRSKSTAVSDSASPDKPKKHHAPKDRHSAAIRRKKLVDAVLKGKDVKAVAISTGLAPANISAQVNQILKHPQSKSRFLKALEAAGLSDDVVASHHLELLNGKRYLPIRGERPENVPTSADPSNPDVVGLSAIPDGVDAAGYIAVPDLQAKAKGLEMIHKLEGAYTEKHEIDLKRPVNVIIRKFSADPAASKEGK
jgi:hypothetical protein